MSNHRVDWKDLIEEITGLKVYPVVIPQGATYPCIEMNITGGSRNIDSNIKNINIRDYRINLTICSSSVAINAGHESELVDALDGKSITQNETKSLIMYHSNTIEIYNYSQGLHEMTVEFTSKKLN